MCLYPKLIRNKKYLPTKKNNYNPPKMADPRTAYITAACGKCLECRKQKQREWLVRMSEELRTEPNAYFMTLTISDENYQILKNICKSEDDNTIATKPKTLMLIVAPNLIKLESIPTFQPSSPNVQPNFCLYARQLDHWKVQYEFLDSHNFLHVRLYLACTYCRQAPT